MRQKLNQYQLFSKLQRAMRRKFQPNPKAVNVLPNIDVDFSPFFEKMVTEKPDPLEHERRWDFNHQYKILKSEARGRPEIVPLNMLLISYLRRETPFTSHALALFERLWSEHLEEMLEVIPTRDLISTLRTFGDHAKDNTRRLSAKLGFTYAHIIKLYESERVNEDHSLKNGSYEIPAINPKIGLDKLWGVRFGGDNSFEIQNVIIAEEIMTDEVIGPMLLTLLTRFQNGNTIFSRFDHARYDSNYLLETERNWSFGFNPFRDLDEDEG